ncbi:MULTISPECIES: sulfite exporter TauE/SafE family protein [Thiomicrorhabdus]|uniref:Probable membrane transporter protein n=1 Tax=Thiomicrorhabdus heinhorstiae TaxID=2748010 RepID=A0ABS0BV21_9GAMM|nr:MULTISPECIES: sulfite exporter TauE/SafE family protein [Thiomicrorhabdus]MBF6057625.1 sulfite exporter TauE/SafE family protein [Thiomicrorhabdus heinhorstiae]
MNLLDQGLLFLVSLIANLFSALAGGGAGLLQLPALLFLGLPFGLALATHKVASVFLGLGATARHMKSSSLDWKFAAFILAAGLPGVVLGASLILMIDDHLAQGLLGLLTLGLGIYSWFKPELGQVEQQSNRDRKGYLIGFAVLFIIGALNGSLTSGTGLFVTLWLVRWFGLDYKSAVAYTLVLVGIFWNGSGALTLGILGDIQWSWLPALILGSLIGGYLGAHYAIVKGNRLVKRSFEVVTVLVGISLIIKAFSA